MIRSAALCRFTALIRSCTRGSGLLPARVTSCVQLHSPSHTPILRRLDGPPTTPHVPLRYSDLTSNKFTMIYTLPHIKLLRAVSRLKLLQTAFTVVILPPVFALYLHGDAPFFLVGYTTGIALLAGAVLYAASHLFRRVVGMMYLDPSQTTLKVSHLTFWGKRSDLFLPVSDVMTIADTGDSPGEVILRLKRYSDPHTFYFSTRYGRVVDQHAFEKVFGPLK